MRWLWFSLLTAIFSACSVLSAEPGGEGDQPAQVDTAQPTVGSTAIGVQLVDLGPAPELENEIWLNVEQPLRLADLHGKVVLLDMWTFG